MISDVIVELNATAISLMQKERHEESVALLVEALEALRVESEENSSGEESDDRSEETKVDENVMKPIQNQMEDDKPETDLSTDNPSINLHGQTDNSLPNAQTNDSDGNALFNKLISEHTDSMHDLDKSGKFLEQFETKTVYSSDLQSDQSGEEPSVTSDLAGILLNTAFGSIIGFFFAVIVNQIPGGHVIGCLQSWTIRLVKNLLERLKELFALIKFTRIIQGGTRSTNNFKKVISKTSSVFDLDEFFAHESTSGQITTTLPPTQPPGAATKVAAIGDNQDDIPNNAHTEAKSQKPIKEANEGNRSTSIQQEQLEGTENDNELVEEFLDGHFENDAPPHFIESVAISSLSPRSLTNESSLDLEFYFINKPESDNVFPFYQKAFVVRVDAVSNDTKEAGRENSQHLKRQQQLRGRQSAVLFFNMALAHHSYAVNNLDSAADYQMAIELYESVISIVQESLDDASAEDFLLLLLAAMNNKGHIYSNLCNIQEMRSTMESLHEIINITREIDSHPMLENADFLFFYRNLLVFQEQEFSAAPAA